MIRVLSDQLGQARVTGPIPDQFSQARLIEEAGYVARPFPSELDLLESGRILDIESDRQAPRPEQITQAGKVIHAPPVPSLDFPPERPRRRAMRMPVMIDRTPAGDGMGDISASVPDLIITGAGVVLGVLGILTENQYLSVAGGVVTGLGLVDAIRRLAA